MADRRLFAGWKTAVTDFLSSSLPNTARATNAPPVLLPYQQAWVGDDAQLKIAEKSRRIGLTWAEASDDVLIAAGAGGSNCFYIGPMQDMALEYIEACSMWAKAFNQAAGVFVVGIFKVVVLVFFFFLFVFLFFGLCFVVLLLCFFFLCGLLGVFFFVVAVFFF